MFDWNGYPDIEKEPWKPVLCANNTLKLGRIGSVLMLG